MKTEIIKYYEIVMSTYHNTPVGRIRFVRENGIMEESALYTPSELSNIIFLWKADALLGSFANGTILAENAAFQLCEA